MVIAKDQQRTVLKTIIPREKSVVDRIHLFPIDVLSPVNARDSSRKHEMTEMATDACLPTGVGRNHVCWAQARELNWNG